MLPRELHNVTAACM